MRGLLGLFPVFVFFVGTEAQQQQGRTLIMQVKGSCDRWTRVYDDGAVVEFRKNVQRSRRISEKRIDQLREALKTAPAGSYYKSYLPPGLQEVEILAYPRLGQMNIGTVVYVACGREGKKHQNGVKSDERQRYASKIGKIVNDKDLLKECDCRKGY